MFCSASPTAYYQVHTVDAMLHATYDTNEVFSLDGEAPPTASPTAYHSLSYHTYGGCQLGLCQQ